MNKEEKLENLQQEASECKKCTLWKTRKNVVFGDGAPSSIMFIGEAPGFNEDASGKPFVGRAGKLLDELLNKIGLTRNNVYISNIVKCRPPENRDPYPNEIKVCFPYLEKQIEIIKPEVIICLGRHSSKQILEKFNQKFSGITQDHGKHFIVSTLYGKIIIVPMYHPAAALYNPNLKEDIIKDFLKLNKELQTFKKE